MNWRYSGDTTYNAFLASLPPTSVLIGRNEVLAVYDAASPFTRLFRGILQAESSGGIDFNAVPASFNNPVNLRIRGKEPFQQFPSVVDCVVEWKDRLTSPTYAYKDTQTVAELVHIYAPSSDNNNEAAYVATVERVISSLPLQQKGPSIVDKSTWQWYDVAGLDKKIQLPVPLVIDLIPVGQTNQRPGYTRTTPGYWVQHETDNHSVGANAKMHDIWMHNGAKDGNGNPTKTGWHFTVDDGVIYQHLPVNETGWHAADGWGPGNMSGIGCELCVNAGIDTATARHNAEALAAGVGAALPVPITPDRVKRHWDFNAGNAPEFRHHCPDEIMNDGYFPTFVQNVSVITNSGETVPIEQKYPDPFIPGWLTDDWIEGGEDAYLGDGGSKTKVFSCRRRWTPAKDTPRLQHAGKDAPSIGPDVKKGESFIGCGVFHSNGQWFILTKWGTRLRMDDMTDRMIPGYPEKGKV